MNKTSPLYFFLFFWIALCTGSYSQKNLNKSLWQSADFFSSAMPDAKKPLHYFDNKSYLQYDISNDEKNVYIRIKITENALQKKITASGLELRTGTSGNEKKQCCITYPLVDFNKMSFPPGDMHPGKGKSDEKMKREFFKMKYKEMQLSGFKDSVNGISSLNNKFGIKLIVDWDTMNFMYYKVAIPFKTFYRSELSRADSTTVFYMSFTINGIEMPDFNHGNGPGGGKPGGETGSGMPGGGMGGGMPGGGNMSDGGSQGGGNRGNGPPEGGDEMQMKNTLSEKTFIKIRILMAIKP
jgi:hypothetical protein